MEEKKLKLFLRLCISGPFFDRSDDNITFPVRPETNKYRKLYRKESQKESKKSKQNKHRPKDTEHFHEDSAEQKLSLSDTKDRKKRNSGEK